MKLIHFLKLVCLSALLFTVSCKAEKYDDPLSSVYQTQWKGVMSTAKNSNEVPLLAFDSDTTGVVAYTESFGEEKISSFKYKRSDKIISIDQCSIHSFNREWWIEKQTRSELILHSYANTSISQKLVLNRIY